MSNKSPFKFLDAYNKGDRDIFFGRDAEVEQLYNLVFQSNLTLVYGQSGTGKTSLVKCGLANRFATSDWFDVYIRRNDDINQSLLETLQRFKIRESRTGTLRERLMKKRQGIVKSKIRTVSTLEENEVIKILKAIYKHYLKPIYLVFDQFEELFILGNREEQEKFYHAIADILDSENYCRIIFVMREESIAQLYDFERIVPHLFDKRLRVEPMSRNKTREVIVKTTEKFDIQLANTQVPDQIIDFLSSDQGRVELTYLQVLLDRFYQDAARRTSNGIVFDSHLIKQAGSIENVLAEFLDNQSEGIQKELEKIHSAVPSSAVSKVLNTFVTLEGTKRPLHLEDVKIGSLDQKQIEFIVDGLEKGRILRFEDNHYELSHDTLAKRVASQRSADEVALLQVAKLVRDRQQVYDTTKTYLNTNELQLVENYRRALDEEHSLSVAEWKFIAKSDKAEKRRKAMLIRGAALLITVLAAFSIFSLAQWQKAQDNYRQFQAEQAKRAQNIYNEYLAKGQGLMASANYKEATEELNRALSFNDTGKVALQLWKESKALLRKKEQFEQLMATADSLERLGDRKLIDAQEKYLVAQEIQYNDKLVQSKLSTLQGNLELAFERFKRSGDTFFKTRNTPGYQKALDYYREASRIKPNDRYILGRIRDCERRLK